MTPHGLQALRRAALLCHTLPDATLRVRHGDVLLVTVGGSARGALHHLRPCQFRLAVARAWAHATHGGRLCFLGLDEGCDPAIDLAIPGGAIHAGGIVEARLPDRGCIASTTTLDAPMALATLRPLVPVSSHPSRPSSAAGATVGIRIDVHHDDALGCTLVWAEHHDTIASSTHLQLMRDVVTRCATAELDQDLTALTLG